MSIAPNSIELWRRMILLLGLLVGLGLFFYVAPAMVTITAIDWQEEQANEIKSYGIISREREWLNQLPLNEYIQEKTKGQVMALDASHWEGFFEEIQLASKRQYASSSYANRVSKLDRDGFWLVDRNVEVFFKPEEISYGQWGLISKEGARSYISIDLAGKDFYYLLKYHDYDISVGPMSKPFRIAPSWLYHPYRILGLFISGLALLLYIFLPRRKKNASDISYSVGSLIAADIVALILLVTFYGLPFLINGGTRQAFYSFWIITLIMWLLAIFALILLYYNAWFASYRIELGAEGIYIISFKGVRVYPFRELSAVNLVSLRNPSWFRKLSLAIAFLALMSGQASPQPVGSALLTLSAAYGGLELCSVDNKPFYIWFTDQNGGLIVNNFALLVKGLKDAGIDINTSPREIKGLAMFK